MLKQELDQKCQDYRKSTRPNTKQNQQKEPQVQRDAQRIWKKIKKIFLHQKADYCDFTVFIGYEADKSHRPTRYRFYLCAAPFDTTKHSELYWSMRITTLFPTETLEAIINIATGEGLECREEYRHRINDHLFMTHSLYGYDITHHAPAIG